MNPRPKRVHSGTELRFWLPRFLSSGWWPYGLAGSLQTSSTLPLTSRFTSGGRLPQLLAAMNQAVEWTPFPGPLDRCGTS
jgi:hypothetical protein